MAASRVIEAAEELFRARQYGSAVSRCAEVLAYDPDNLDLRILRARALMALRRDEEAKRELSRVLRWHPDCGVAYRLLGELAIRMGKIGAAGTFLERAVHLAPDDETALGLLELVESSNQPTVAVEKLPAATATVGCPFSADETTIEDDSPAGARIKRLASGSQFERPPGPVRADRFGRYLVDIGALTPIQLRAVLDYHRRVGVKVGAAAVALGFLSEPSVEWAAHDYHIHREA